MSYVRLERRPDVPRPFRSAEQAWIWCAQLLAARRDGRAPRADLGEGGNRPCTPDDIVREIERLNRAGRISLDQAKILRAYGDKGRCPSPNYIGEEQDFYAWRRAMYPLQEVLVARGIVVSGKPERRR